MSAIKILIATDDLKKATKLAGFLKELDYQITEITTGKKLRQSIADIDANLVLMDTFFSDGTDSLKLAGTIAHDYGLPVIFFSDMADPLLENQIKALESCKYITGPYSKKKLGSAIENALYNVAKSKERFLQKDDEPATEKNRTKDHLTVRFKSQLVKLSLNEILMVEACDNYSFIITLNQKYLVSYTLKEVNKKLPASTFIRTHRSHIVNLKKVDGIEENSVIVNNKTIPVGKSFRKDLMARFISA